MVERSVGMEEVDALSEIVGRIVEVVSSEDVGIALGNSFEHPGGACSFCTHSLSIGALICVERSVGKEC